MDVVKLIRSRRFVHLALKHLLSPALRRDFKQKSELKELSIEPSHVVAVSKCRGNQVTTDLSIEMGAALPELNDASIEMQS